MEEEYIDEEAFGKPVDLMILKSPKDRQIEGKDALYLFLSKEYRGNYIKIKLNRNYANRMLIRMIGKPVVIDQNLLSEICDCKGFLKNKQDFEYMIINIENNIDTQKLTQL